MLQFEIRRPGVPIQRSQLLQCPGIDRHGELILKPHHGMGEIVRIVVVSSGSIEPGNANYCRQELNIRLLQLATGGVACAAG